MRSYECPPRGYDDHPMPEGHTPQGTSRWMTATELEQAIDAGLANYRDGDLFFGRSSITGTPVGMADDRHVCLLSNSRGGKGRSIITPNLCLYPGSAIVLDFKGENFKATGSRRCAGAPGTQGMGQKVIALDPYGVADGADAFNPLDVIDLDDEEVIEVASLISDAIVIRSNDKDSHWDEVAQNLIRSGLLAVKAHPMFEGHRDLTTVARLLSNSYSYPDEFLQELRGEGEDEDEEAEIDTPYLGLIYLFETVADMDVPISDVCAAAANLLMMVGENERGSIISTLSRNLEWLRSRRMERAISHSTGWSPADFKALAEGATLYLILPARYASRNSRWLRMMINLIVGVMERQGTAKPANDHSVLMVLDEFATLGFMKILETAAGYMAGFHLKLLIVLQDISQLKRHYKEGWQTFLGNCGTVIAYAVTDPDTTEYLSKRLGRVDVGTIQISRARSETITDNDESAAEKRERGRLYGGTVKTSVSENNNQSMTANRTSTALMTADEVARYFARETGLALVLMAGAEPMIIPRINYDQDVLFAGMVVNDGR